MQAFKVGVFGLRMGSRWADGAVRLDFLRQYPRLHGVVQRVQCRIFARESVADPGEGG